MFQKVENSAYIIDGSTTATTILRTWANNADGRIIDEFEVIVTSSPCNTVSD